MCLLFLLKYQRHFLADPINSHLQVFTSRFFCLGCPLPPIGINHQTLPEHLICAKDVGPWGIRATVLSSWHPLLSLQSSWREQMEGKCNKASINQDTRSGNRNGGAEELLSPEFSGLAHRAFSAYPI